MSLTNFMKMNMFVAVAIVALVTVNAIVFGLPFSLWLKLPMFAIGTAVFVIALLFEMYRIDLWVN